jgi:hypothetical protein
LRQYDPYKFCEVLGIPIGVFTAQVTFTSEGNMPIGDKPLDRLTVDKVMDAIRHLDGTIPEHIVLQEMPDGFQSYGGTVDDGELAGPAHPLVLDDQGIQSALSKV